MEDLQKMVLKDYLQEWQMKTEIERTCILGKKEEENWDVWEKDTKEKFSLITLM